MDTAALLLRVVVALASVLGLVWLFSRGMTRGRGRRMVPGMTEVVSRQALSRAASVVVVRVGERALVLGVTEHQVSLLTETDLPAEDVAARRTEVIALSSDGDRPVDVDLGDVTTLIPQPRSASTPTAAAAATPVAVTAAATTRVRPRPRRQEGGPLAGSALSPATWGQALDVLRERTTRR